MTAPQNPASAPGPAGFEAPNRRAPEPGGRRRADPPLRGSLSDAGPGGPPPAPPAPPARPAPPAQRPGHFDVRSEMAALAAEPHPFAFWQRAEQLPDRFEQEQRGSGPASRPVTEPSRPSTGGLPSLSGDLGGAPARPAEMSGSLEPDEPRHGRPESASLSGSLLPPAENPRPAPNPAPDSGPQPQVRDGVLRGPLTDGPPSGPVPQVSDAPPPVEAPRPPHPPMARPPMPEPPMPEQPVAHPPTPEPSMPEPPEAQPPRPEPPMSEPPEAPFAEQASLPPRPDAAQRPDGPPPSPPAGMPPVGPPSGPRPQGPPPGPPSGPMPQAGPPPGRPAGPPPPQHPSPPAGSPAPPNGGQQRPPRPQGPPPMAPPPRPGPPPAPQQPEQPVAQQPPRRPEPPRPPEPPQQDQERPKSRTARTPKINERADGGFGPMGSAGAWANGTGRAGYGRNTSWSADDFKEERREGGDDLRAGSGYKPGETGSGAVPQFLIEADELWDDDDGGRLVAPPVLGESPASFRDF
ncbi:hypothetical protein [Saccharopolyspora endophytica]|uniref:Basic proline-rich protein n=1 Tax=Saccharopolyspora endophytica TaxID=543886 RepID=A0ABS5DNV3_9PSEU|nr:hypothetical protein [Saccharopolyspora endophytica]MBQ0927984.1 hypothetical protein [Saccharopolyspora endophytica]